MYLSRLRRSIAWRIPIARLLIKLPSLMWTQAAAARGALFTTPRSEVVRYRGLFAFGVGEAEVAKVVEEGLAGDAELAGGGRTVAVVAA